VFELLAQRFVFWELSMTFSSSLSGILNEVVYLLIADSLHYHPRLKYLVSRLKDLGIELILALFD